ncbi:MAG: YsnF/AvaK domain-containing protein [Acidobacteriota bacterium]|nr:YsnF/AvaK domain-containing protein [Acidobacteriota bacterium]
MDKATMTTVVGVFNDHRTAKAVARELEDSGFSSGDVRITGQDHDTGGQESGIGHFFRHLFGSDVDDRDTGYYEEAIGRGSAVVTVDADQDMTERAVEIMNRNGAINVDQGGDTRQYERSGAPERESLDRDSGRRSIPVVEEELQVGKRAVQRGGVRIYSHVTERPVEEQVTLRDERVNVERHAVDRPVSAADTANLRDQTIEVTEMSEEPVISKRARVVEEVSIGKEITERTETVRDKVRRSDVKVEKLGKKETVRTATGDYDSEFRQDFDTRYAGQGYNYDSYGPAYQYGYSTASEPRYQGKSWDQIESNLKTDYLRNNPNSTWEEVKGAVRYGWEKVTGKRSAAG